MPRHDEIAGRPDRSRFRTGWLADAGCYAWLGLWVAVTLFPIYWMVATSFKSPQEWFAWPPNWLPANATTANYEMVAALAAGGGRVSAGVFSLSALVPIRDSLIVALISSALALILGTLLAYTIARYRTGGRYFPHLLLLIRMLPPVVIAVPVAVYFTLPWWQATLHDAYLGLIIPYVFVTLPYAVWLMLSFLPEVPRELEDAARIMGAGRMTILRRVVLSLLRPGLAATFAFLFILNWSEFFLAVTLAGEDLVTVPVQLTHYSRPEVGPQAAFGTLAIIPLVVLGFAIQKHLATGFSFGMVRR